MSHPLLSRTESALPGMCSHSGFPVARWTSHFPLSPVDWCLHCTHRNVLQRLHYDTITFMWVKTRTTQHLTCFFLPAMKPQSYFLKVQRPTEALSGILGAVITPLQTFYKNTLLWTVICAFPQIPRWICKYFLFQKLTIFCPPRGSGNKTLAISDTLIWWTAGKYLRITHPAVMKQHHHSFGAVFPSTWRM